MRHGVHTFFILHTCVHTSAHTSACSWQDTNQVEYVLQLGALSMVPFLAEQVLERGLTDALLNTLHQVRRAGVRSFPQHFA